MRKKNTFLSIIVFTLVLSILFGFSFLPTKKLTVAAHTTKSEQLHEQRKVFQDSNLAKSIEMLNPIHLVFAGDIIIHASTVQAVERNGLDFPFVHVRDEIQSADYAVANLETAVTTRNTPFPKSFNFKMQPHYLQGIKNAGFQMVTLANNHTLDYREEGLVDTLNHLTEYGIEYIGAGKNAAEAYAAKTVEINGKTVAFLGFSHVLPEVSWYAGDNKPGIASGYQYDRMERRIKEEKEKADYVIVYIHWGEELQQTPASYQVNYGRGMIDAGADAVIGAHPHVVQPIEEYKGKPIAYSLGNFLFPNHVHGPTAQTGLLHIYLKGDQVEYEFNEYKIQNDQIVPVP